MISVSISKAKATMNIGLNIAHSTGPEWIA
ncbi:hypothetical protein MEZE111188_10700 [Mesobacillus zeae]